LPVRAETWYKYTGPDPGNFYRQKKEYGTGTNLLTRKIPTALTESLRQVAAVKRVEIVYPGAIKIQEQKLFFPLSERGSYYRFL
jgi:hypothetical protein